MTPFDLINIAVWPLWLQIPAVIIGLWVLWKALTVPYWGPTA